MRRVRELQSELLLDASLLLFRSGLLLVTHRDPIHGCVETVITSFVCDAK